MARASKHDELIKLLENIKDNLPNGEIVFLKKRVLNIEKRQETMCGRIKEIHEFTSSANGLAGDIRNLKGFKSRVNKMFTGMYIFIAGIITYIIQAYFKN
jgi:hypothetical protein